MQASIFNSKAHYFLIKFNLSEILINEAKCTRKRNVRIFHNATNLQNAERGNQFIFPPHERLI